MAVVNPLGIDLDQYKYGFHDRDDTYAFKSQKGLNRGVIEMISHMKSEPDWMRAYRLHSLGVFDKKPMPMWGGNVGERLRRSSTPHEADGEPGQDAGPGVARRSSARSTAWASRRRRRSTSRGSARSTRARSCTTASARSGRACVVFLDMDSALREYPDIVKEYFGTVVPPEDNKFAASTARRGAAARSCTSRRACT